jgi:hypothetical protein
LATDAKADLMPPMRLKDQTSFQPAFAAPIPNLVDGEFVRDAQSKSRQPSAHYDLDDKKE